MFEKFQNIKNLVVARFLTVDKQPFEKKSQKAVCLLIYKSNRDNKASRK